MLEHELSISKNILLAKLLQIYSEEFKYNLISDLINDLGDIVYT